MNLSKHGNRYVLVFQNYLTKWPGVQTTKAATVAHCLTDFIWRHGVPAQLIHDRAAEFLSDILQENAEILGVTQVSTSGGHPQIDGTLNSIQRR